MAVLTALETGVLTSGVTSITNASVFGGETPKAALILFYIASANHTSVADAVMGYGFVSGSTCRSVSMLAEDGVASSNTERATSDVYAINLRNPSGGSYVAQWSASLVANGIQFTPTTTLNSARVSVLLFGGDGIEGADVGTIATATAGSGTVTGVGFQPDLAFFSSCGMGSNTAANDAIISIGCAALDSGTTLTQYSTLVYSEDGNTTATLNTRVNSTSVAGQLTATGISWQYAIDSFTSDGWDYTQTGSSAGDITYYLALKLKDTSGIRIDHDSLASGASSWTSNNFGGEIAGGFFSLPSSCNTLNANRTTNTVGNNNMFFTKNRAHLAGWADRDGFATMDTARIRSTGSLDGVSTTSFFDYDVSTWTAVVDTDTDQTQLEFTSITSRIAASQLLWYVGFTAGAGVSGVYEGSTEITGIYEGSTEIVAAYEGSTQIF